MECRTKKTKNKNPNYSYKICYEKKSPSNVNTMTPLKELTNILENERPSFLKNSGEMFVITSTTDKYLNSRTPSGNPIKILERATYKSRDAAISMLVMPKNGDNLMVQAGKKKGNSFTFSLKKLEVGLQKGSMTLTKVKSVSTPDWEGGDVSIKNTKRSKTPPRPRVRTPPGRPVNNIKRRAKTPTRNRSYTPVREAVPPKGMGEIVRGRRQDLKDNGVDFVSRGRRGPPRVNITGANFTSRTKLGRANRGPQSGFLTVKNVRKSNTIQWSPNNVETLQRIFQ